MDLSLTGDGKADISVIQRHAHIIRSRDLAGRLVSIFIETQVFGEWGMESLAENRRARFDYEVLDTVEAGIELKGFEVKSVKTGRMQLPGSYIVIREGEAWLLNATIPPYQPNNTEAGYDPSRTRRLLLHKAEINKILGKLKEKSFVIIPLRAYAKKNIIKLELGIGRPKKAHDKREALKKKSAVREMRHEE